jgi:hypothetical protein
VALADVGQAKAETTVVNQEENKYRQIFRMKEVHYLATMLLIYVGVAVTIGGEDFLFYETDTELILSPRRVVRYVHHKCAWWWSELRLHFLWILWW